MLWTTAEDEGEVRALKNRFKLPVIVYYWSFQGDTSVVVTFVLCFGVEFLWCLNFICVFIFYLSSGNWVATYWEIATNSAYDMFS